ncbi:MAG: hypothetical protein SFX18_07330 [Pirellulales bacterium]|nr:hypothetical protein [Pirellulales bacterium]
MAATSDPATHPRSGSNLADSPREMRLDTAHPLGQSQSSHVAHAPHIDAPLAVTTDKANSQAAGLLRATQEFSHASPTPSPLEALSPEQPATERLLENLRMAENALQSAWQDWDADPALAENVRQIWQETTGETDLPTPVEWNAWQSSLTQLRQVARILAERQSDLDRREANILAQTAQAEEFARGTQLLLREQHARSAEQQLAYEAANHELATRSARLEADTDQLARRQAELEIREAQLRDWERNLSERAGELERHETHKRAQSTALHEQTACLTVEAELLERRLAALRMVVRQFLDGQVPQPISIGSLRGACAARPSTGDPAHPLRAAEQKNTQPTAGAVGEFDIAECEVAPADRLEQELEHFIREVRELAGRRERLLASEHWLDCARREWELRHDKLLAQERDWASQMRLAERDFAERQAREQARGIEQLAAVNVAQQQLETRRAAVEQLRAELTLAQRDLLQDRLALEEIATELSGRLPAAQLAEGLLRARGRLAEFYRLQTDQLAEERRKLESILTALPSEQHKLSQRQQTLEQWVREREQDFAGLAARLSMQEQELARERQRLQAQEDSLADERLGYQREIRRLLSELGE